MAMDWEKIKKQNVGLINDSLASVPTRVKGPVQIPDGPGQAVLPDPGDDPRAEVRQETQLGRGVSAATLAERAAANERRNGKNSGGEGKEAPAGPVFSGMQTLGIPTPMLELAGMVREAGQQGVTGASGLYAGLPDPGDDPRAEVRQETQLGRGVPAATLAERARVNGERQRASALAGLEWERQDLEEELGVLRRGIGIQAVRQGMTSPAARRAVETREKQVQEKESRLKAVEQMISALRPEQRVDVTLPDVYDGNAGGNDPMNWESELEETLKQRIGGLSPGLSEESRVEAVDAIITEEAKRLQQKYRTVYSATSNNFVSSIFSPGLHEKLTPLYAEYPTEETESNPIFQAAANGFQNAFYPTLLFAASEGIYPQRAQNGVTEGAGNGLLPKTTAESVSAKLDTYLLEPTHPVGGSKAKWFKEALGFTKDNSADLVKQIVFNPEKAIQTTKNAYGTKFSQVISVQGANGKIIDVEFIFIKNNDGVIRLVTSIPAKR